MIIDYNTMKEEVIPNFKGGEGEMVTRMFNDELNRIMAFANIRAGTTIWQKPSTRQASVLTDLTTEATAGQKANAHITAISTICWTTSTYSSIWPSGKTLANRCSCWATAWPDCCWL